MEKKEAVFSWRWRGNLCPWNPESYLTPLVRETFDLIPQGCKHLEPRPPSASLSPTVLLWLGQMLLVLPVAQAE